MTEPDYIDHDVYREYLVEQRSEEWFKLREGKLTGSNFATILEQNPYQSMALYHTNRAKEKPFKGNMHTEHGNSWESTAVEVYAREMGIETIKYPGFVVPKGLGFIGVSPDGIAWPNYDAVLMEVKCPSAKDGYGGCPPIYMPQVQGNMKFMGISVAHFIVYRPCHHGGRMFSVDGDAPDPMVTPWKLEVWEVRENVQYQNALFAGLEWFHSYEGKMFAHKEAQKLGVQKTINPYGAILSGIHVDVKQLLDSRGRLPHGDT